MKNIPTKKEERVFSIKIYNGSFILPDAIICRFTMMVLMQFIDGPNRNIFLAIAEAIIKDSALPFLPEMMSRCEIMVSYCSAYLVTRKRQKY